MKIEKLPSGSYRIRKTYKGQTYTVIFESKPTQKEAMQAMAKELDKVQAKHGSMDFRAAAEKYLESKKNILSPSTIRGYATIMKQIPEGFMSKKIYDITALDVQNEINRMAKKCSPKSVRNHHGFISAVLGTFYPGLKLTTTLPQKIKKEPYIPSDEDVRRILVYSIGTEYEIPIILACHGLRRSEICALSPEDIDGDVAHITKAMVQDKNFAWVIKTTKTAASTREVAIPKEIASRICQQGYVYQGYPGEITKFLYSAESKLGIPHFSIHKLRHYFVSKLSSINVPEADILRMGGWETDHVMKSVYRHSMKAKNMDTQRTISEQLTCTIIGK